MQETISHYYYETNTPVHDIEELFSINKRKLRHLVDKRYGRFYRRDQMYWNQNQDCYMPIELVELQVVARLRNGDSVENIVEDIGILPQTVNRIAKKFDINQSTNKDSDEWDRGDALEDAVVALWEKNFTTFDIAKRFGMPEDLAIHILYLNGIRFKGVVLPINIERTIIRFAKKVRGPL